MKRKNIYKKIFDYIWKNVVFCGFFKTKMIVFFVAFFVVTLTWLYYRFGRYSAIVVRPYDVSEDGRDVPVVEEGWFPFVGHGFAFGRDVIGFCKSAQAKYGDVFRLRIFRKDIIVVCDHTLKDEYFKATEERMSLYDVLRQIYFGYAFSDKEQTLSRIIDIVKRSIKVNFDEFTTKIMDEAGNMAKRLAAQTKGPTGASASPHFDLSAEMIRFVTFTSARCFVGIRLSDDFFTLLMKFAHRLNSTVVMTYFLPRIVLRYTVGFQIKRYREQLIEMLVPEIQTYRADPNKKESQVMRLAVDFRDDNDGYALTDQEVGEVIICLLYVSSENTALGLSSTMLDLMNNPQWWDKCARASAQNLADGDYKSLFTASPLLDGVINESARMNTHIFPIGRRPTSTSTTLGEWYVGNTDCISLCPPMLMLHNCSPNVAPTEYHPERFTTGVVDVVTGEVIGSKESATPKNIMTWGAGSHFCPGKMFAIYEIKAAIALLTTQFKMPTIVSQSGIDYFSPSAFAERPAVVMFNTRDDDDDLFLLAQSSSSRSTSTFKSTTTSGHRVIEFTSSSSSDKGYLIRNYLSRDEQISFYEYTMDLAANTKELKEAMFSATSQHAPLAYDNLVYLSQQQSSNCAFVPTRWYELANRIWNTIGSATILPSFDANSFYSQLFIEQGRMANHRDEYVTWGVSVSLGSSCDFNFDGQNITLNTGDVFVADFSKITHGVTLVHDNVPGWWPQQREEMDDGVVFRPRLSVQIRDVKQRPTVPLSTTQFKDALVTDTYPTTTTTTN